MLADLGANVRNDARIAKLMGGGKCAKSRLMFYLSANRISINDTVAVYIWPRAGAPGSRVSKGIFCSRRKRTK